jgi:hypothetical protein
MKRVHKQIVTDENNRPIAVQIPYAEWLGIEELLSAESPKVSGDPSRLAGSLQWGEDGVAYQRRVREEWTR